MPEDEQYGHGRSSIDNRVWRIEQILADINRRIDKIDARVEPLAQRQEERGWRSQALEDRVNALEKKGISSGNPIIGDSPIVRTILYGLLIMVGTLATGTFLNTVGLFK